MRRTIILTVDQDRYLSDLRREHGLSYSEVIRAALDFMRDEGNAQVVRESVFLRLSPSHGRKISA
jgi:Arc/MetJ-type ribon-helix-helix transcriptional regulator